MIGPKQPWVYHNTKNGTIMVREDVLFWGGALAVFLAIIVPASAMLWVLI